VVKLEVPSLLPRPGRGRKKKGKEFRKICKSQNPSATSVPGPTPTPLLEKSSGENPTGCGEEKILGDTQKTSYHPASEIHISSTFGPRRIQWGVKADRGEG